MATRPVLSNILEETTAKVLDVMAQFIDANTVFISCNDQVSNTILSSYNRFEVLIEAGETFTYADAY